MVLFAVTRRPLSTPPRGIRSKEVGCDGWVITTWVDGRNGYCMCSPLRGEATEAVSLGAGDEVVSARIRFDLHAHTFELTRMLLGDCCVYYYRSPEGELICATHVSLLKAARVPLKEEPKVLPAFLVYRVVTPPSTLFEGVSQVLAGSTIFGTIGRDGCVLTGERQYRLERSQEIMRMTADDWVLVVMLSLRRYVQRLALIMDESSLLLSGGLDSSTLLCLLKREYAVKETYSTGFPFELPELNREREYAVSAAAAMGTVHRYYEITTADYLAGVIRAIAAAEQPVHHLQSVLIFLLMERGLPATRPFVISGMGADNVFGSEMEIEIAAAHTWPYRLLGTRLLEPLLRSAVRIGGRGRRLMRSADLSRADMRSDILDDFSHVFWQNGRYGNLAWVQERFKVSEWDIIGERYEVLRQYRDLPLLDLVAVSTATTGIARAIWSRLGEQGGKTILYPFADDEFMKLALSVPAKVKYRSPKHVLRQIARKAGLPEFIITRPKSGFGLRRPDWAIRGGVFEPLVPVAAKGVEEDDIRSVQKTDPDLAAIYWNLLNYGIWKRLWVNGEPVESLLEELAESIEQSVYEKEDAAEI